MPTEAIAVPLAFPEIRLKRIVRGGKEFVLDPVRKTFVRLTPEEWVRQHALTFLIETLQVPGGLIAVEKSFTYNGMQRRADIVVHDRAGSPLIVVECKSPTVRINQGIFDQASRYNSEIRAPYVIVTNGKVHFCFFVDFEARSHRFMADLPSFDLLQKEFS